MAFTVDSPHNEAHRQAVESDRRPSFKMYDLWLVKNIACLTKLMKETGGQRRASELQ